MKKRLILLLLGLFSVSTYALTPVEEIQTILEKPKLLCGDFAQKKQLVGINKPLLSNGRFCVMVDKGILWQTVKPFSNTLRLTQNDIIQTQGDQTTLHLSSTQEPVVRMINSVLFSLLAGNLSQLNKIFLLDGSVFNKHWRVSLKARDPQLAKVIGTIHLEGDQHIRHVKILEANGDQTAITFSHIINNITPQEEASFAQ